MNDKITIGILDYSPLSRASGRLSPTTIKEIRAIKTAIESEGHRAVIYKVPECQMFFHGRKFQILERNKPIKMCDVLIPRPSITDKVELELTLVKQFEMLGVPVLNKSLPTHRAKNKLRTIQILTQLGIPSPRTVVVRRLTFLNQAIELLGGYPVIVKSPFGSYGNGVIILESQQSLYSALDVLWASMRMLLIQQFIKEGNATDYRVFVVGKRVVAAMERTAKNGEFRSNLHLGGEAKITDVTPEEKRIAIKATQALGLDMAGVDIMRSKEGPVIIEVNANPGFTGLSEITGIDVAKEVVLHAISLAKKNRK